MTEHPLRKEYSLRRREKQSAVSNYVIQIVRDAVDQEEQRQHLNVTQKSSFSVGQDRRNQQQWSYYPEKEARIHHDMTNVSVISALVKSDEPTSHRRNNSGKATNHERINDQCRTGNKMINDGNQKDLNMEFFMKPADVMISLTPPLPVVYPPQHLINIPSFSEFYYVVPIF